MIRFTLAAVIGLMAPLSAAQADTIIYQGTPTFEPLVITRGDAAPLPGLTHDILQDPAFHRLTQMCETIGLACDMGDGTADIDIAGGWTPGHRADAEKRMAQLLADRQGAFAQNGFGTPLPIPPRLFGWNAPVPGHLWHGPFDSADPRAHLFPAQPRLAVPHLPRPPHDLSGFYSRLNTPAVIPHGILPRHSFPWRSF